MMAILSLLDTPGFIALLFTGIFCTLIALWYWVRHKGASIGGQPKTMECPVSEDIREWVETSFAWLHNAFGTETLLRGHMYTIFSPLFANLHDGNFATASKVFYSVCNVMGVNPKYVDFQLDHKSIYSGVAGQYTDSYQQAVSINPQILVDKERLIVTCAHELAHVRLHRDTNICHDEPDYEEKTDLTAVFFGFGVPMANTYDAREVIRTLGRTAIRYHTFGYLSQKRVCFAIALLSWIRGETSPQWLSALEPDARLLVEKSRLWLQTTKCSRFLKVRASIAPPIMETANPEELKQMLEDAIKQENYEQAVLIRDRMRQITDNEAK